MSIFRFTYKEDDENGSPKTMLLEPGLASFTVKAIYDTNRDGSPKVTADGTPKISLGLQVTDNKRQSSFIYDDISEKMGWKIKQIATSVGKAHLYDKKGFFNPDDLIACSGQCVLINKDSNNGKSYTNIDKYLPSTVQEENSIYVDVKSTDDDQDLPF